MIRKVNGLYVKAVIFHERLELCGQLLAMSGNNGNSSVSKTVSDALGAPSKKGNAKQDPEYSTLFKDSNGNQRDEKTRAEIKSLASAGYDVSQLKDYLARLDRGELKHSSDDFKAALNYWDARQRVEDILT